MKYHITFCIEAKDQKDAEQQAEGISDGNEMLIVSVDKDDHE